MRKYKCETTCTFGNRYFEVGDPLTVTDDTEVPEHFKWVGGTPEEEPPQEPSSATLLTLSEALDLLDHDNDDHWTKAGIPDVKAVEEIMGEGADITRADIEAEASDLKRQTS